MKKIKVIAAAIIRGALLLSPGAVFAVWQWGKVSALVNIQAAVGLETLFLFVFSFFTVAIHAARDEARKRMAAVDPEVQENENIDNIE